MTGFRLVYDFVVWPLTILFLVCGFSHAQDASKIDDTRTEEQKIAIARQNARWLYANHAYRPDSQLALGDFDGDGKTDVFTNQGKRCKVSTGGKSGWEVTAHAWQGAELLGFADINGDGKTDLVSRQSNDKGVWWSAHYSPPEGQWKYLRDTVVRPESVAFGDFNGDGKTDAFTVTDDGSWQVSLSPNGRFETINSSDEPLGLLRIADFTGDGKADVFTIRDGVWLLSDGGTARYEEIGRGSYPMKSLRFGDFNGDGKTDIFHGVDGKWNIHFYPFSGQWKTINNAPGNDPAGFYFGDFDGDGYTDVMVDSKVGWDVSYKGTGAWETLNDYVELNVALRNVLGSEFKVSSGYISPGEKTRTEYATATLPANGSTVVKALVGSTVEIRNGAKLIQTLTISSGAPNQSFKVGGYRAEFNKWLKYDQNPNPPNVNAPAREVDPVSGQYKESKNKEGAFKHVACEEHGRKGYNILRLDPMDLGNYRGTSERHANGYEIFKGPGNLNLVGNSYTKYSYLIPADFILTPNNFNKLVSNSSFFFSESEQSRSMGFSLSANAGAGGNKKRDSSGQKTGGKTPAGSGSVGYKQRDERTNMDSNSEMCRIQSKRAAQFWLTLNKENAALDDAFVRFLDKMNPSSSDDWKELFDDYGTHYALSSLYGGWWATESYESTQSVFESIVKEKEVSAAGTGTVKGVTLGGAASVAWRESNAKTVRNESSKSISHGIGLTGGGIEAADVAEEEKFVPLKVDLRPIYDIFWAELVTGDVSESRIAHYRELRKVGPAMLKAYKENARRLIARNLKPRIFTLTIMSVKVDKETDSGPSVQLYGYTGVKVNSTDARFIAGPKKSVGLGVVGGSTFTELKSGQIAPTNPATNSMTFSVIPTATRTGVDDNLDKVSLLLYSNYYDQDGSKRGDDNDEPIHTKSGSKLTLLDALKTTKPFVVKAAGNGAAELTITYKVRELGFTMPTNILEDLPEFPGTGKWRKPPAE